MGLLTRTFSFQFKAQNLQSHQKLLSILYSIFFCSFCLQRQFQLKYQMCTGTKYVLFKKNEQLNFQMIIPAHCLQPPADADGRSHPLHHKFIKTERIKSNSLKIVFCH